MGKEWGEQGGAHWVGWDGRDLHTDAHISTSLTYTYHSRPIFSWCWHSTHFHQCPPSLPLPFFLSGNSLGHIRPTHLSRFSSSLCPIHHHTCILPIPPVTKHQLNISLIWWKKKKRRSRRRKMGKKMKWLSRPSRKSVVVCSRQAIFPQLLPLTEPSLPVGEVLIQGLQ